jgi:hypothetical protein
MERPIHSIKTKRGVGDSFHIENQKGSCFFIYGSSSKYLFLENPKSLV